MKYYCNTDDYKKRTHTIRVTFQNEDYKGHIAYKMGGNCLGKSLLNWNPSNLCQDEIDNYIENDCNLKLDEDSEFWTLQLKNEEGNKCSYECDDNGLEEMIVAIEIIDCVVEGLL